MTYKENFEYLMNCFLNELFVYIQHKHAVLEQESFRVMKLLAREM